MTIERLQRLAEWYIPGNIANRNIDLYGVHGNNANSVWAVGEAGTILYYNGCRLGRPVQRRHLQAQRRLRPRRQRRLGGGGRRGHPPLQRHRLVHPGQRHHRRPQRRLRPGRLGRLGGGGRRGHPAQRRLPAGAPSQAAPPPDLNGVWASAANSVWAVGDSGTIRYYNGTAWSGQSGGVAGSDLKGITGTAAGDVWACGANGALTHYDGAVWTPDPQDFTNHLNAVDSLSASAVWQVGDAYTGRAYISFGQASPPAAPAPDVTANGIDTFDYAGRPLAAGKYDNDAYPDLLIGANIADGPGNAREDAGEAYVLRGRSAWPSVIDLEGGAATTIYGADAFDQFPEYMQNPSPDFDVDGTADLLLGTRFADGPGNLRNSCGETYVIYGGSLPSILDLAVKRAGHHLLRRGGGPGVRLRRLRLRLQPGRPDRRLRLQRQAGAAGGQACPTGWSTWSTGARPGPPWSTWAP